MSKPVPISPEGVIFYDLTIIPSSTEPVLHGAAIMLEGDRIMALGNSEALLKNHPNTPKVSMADYLVCPGLMNCHTHAAMSFFRGLGHDNATAASADSSMIEDFFFPAEQQLSAELIEPLAYSYLVDGLKSGVSFFGDAYFFAAGTLRAMERLGLRGAVAEHHADLGGPLPAGNELWQKTKTWIENWSSSRVRPVVYAHATDTVSPGMLKELGEFAAHHGLPFHMHLSQTAGERSRVMAREGKSPVAVADECGLLREGSLLVHLLSADAEDLARLAGSGATAGLCPVSEVIYEGAPEARALLEHGIPIALGTDCPASNDGADVLGEARFFSLLLKMQGLDHRQSSPTLLLDTITKNTAQAFLYPDIGRLAPGMKADLVFLKKGIEAQPSSNPLADLFYSLGAKSVEHVMIDGQWVLWNRQLAKLDEQDLAAAYREALQEIKNRTKLPIQVPPDLFI